MQVPVRFLPGNTLVVPSGVESAFRITDFVKLPSGSKTATAVAFDFGDGDVQTRTLADVERRPEISHTYLSPGRYTLRVQVATGNSLPVGSGTEYQFWQKYSWPVQVAVAASAFTPSSASLDYTAAVHATFSLSKGKRHVLLPLPSLSSMDSYPGHGGGSGDGSGGGGFDTLGDAQVLLVGLLGMSASLRWQFAYGLGRIPVPTECIERAMHVHTDAETLVFGTSSALQSDITVLEEHFRDAVDATTCPDQSGAMAAVGTAIDALVTANNDLQDLQRATLTGGDILVPGDRSIDAGEVQRWYEYATGAVPDTQPVIAGTFGQLRRFSDMRGDAMPQPDMAAVWQWSAVETAMSSVAAFYQAVAQGGFDLNNARILLTAPPGGASCSIRFFDVNLKFWAHATVALAGPNDELTLADMADDGNRIARRNGTCAVTKVVGAMNTSHSPEIPALFDLGRIDQALNPKAYLQTPGINLVGKDAARMMGGQVSYLNGMIGPAALSMVTADGTSVTLTAAPFGGEKDATPVEIAAAIATPAPMPLPSLEEQWASLDPHAAWALVGGRRVRRSTVQHVAHSAVGPDLQFSRIRAVSPLETDATNSPQDESARWTPKQ